jgi:hypothetical protein
VKVRIHEIEACCPHTRVDTRSDGTIGFHFGILLSEEVQSLILKGTIERVQDPFQSLGFDIRYKSRFWYTV